MRGSPVQVRQLAPVLDIVISRGYNFRDGAEHKNEHNEIDRFIVLTLCSYRSQKRLPFCDAAVSNLTVMNKRYSLVCLSNRGGSFYCYDSTTKKRESLGTKNREEAERLLQARNDAERQPQMNMQLAQVYLRHSDSALSNRTWQNVMDTMAPLKTGPTQARWISAMRDKSFDLIREKRLIDTTAEHFFSVLKSGGISMAMHWLPWPILPKPQWPAVKHKDRRAITLEEHRKIIDREYNPEIRAYYQLLWHLGGAQTDIAELTAEDINWDDRTVSYQRNKTGVPVIVSFGNEAASILQALPKEGCLFPSLARIKENHGRPLSIKSATYDRG